MPLAGLEDGIVRRHISGIEFVHKSGLLRKDWRGQSESSSGLVLHPRQWGGGIRGLLQKVVQRHIQPKRLRRQSW
jgi:hypothetical protein